MQIAQTITHFAGRIKNAFNAFVKSMRTYLFIFRGLVLDSLFRYKWDTLIILASGMLGSFIFIGSMAQILLYTKALGNNTMIDVLGYSLQPRSARVFILFSFSVLVFWVIGSLLIYYSNSRILRFVVKYETFCTKRIYLILARLSGLVSPGDFASYDNQFINTLLNRDPRFLGRTIRRLVKLLQPGCTLIFAFGSLFYINFNLSVLMMLTLSVALLLHYRNNRRGAYHHRCMEQTSADRSMILREMTHIAKRKKTSSDSFKVLVEDGFCGGQLPANQDHYRGRFQVLENNILLNNLTMIALLVLVLVVLGKKAFETGEGWGGLIVYIIALRYCMNQIKMISATMTSINRFYPVFLRYFNFVENFKIQKCVSGLSHARKYLVRADETSSESITFKRDETRIMALAVSWPFETSHVPIYMSCLLDGKSGLVQASLKSSRVIAACDGFLYGLSVRELFNFPSDLTSEKLKTDLFDIGIDCQEIQWLDDLDTLCAETAWNQVSLEIRYALAFLSALYAGSEWVIIERPVFDPISDRTRKNLFGRFDGRNIMILYSGSYDTIGQYGETDVAAVDGERLIGSGSINWFTEYRQPLSEKLIAAREKAPKTFSETDDSLQDDLEFEMD